MIIICVLLLLLCRRRKRYLWLNHPMQKRPWRTKNLFHFHWYHYYHQQHRQWDRWRRKRCFFAVIIVIVALVLTLSSFRALILFSLCNSVALISYFYHCLSVELEIEIWLENCYHKHIWLGLFLLRSNAICCEQHNRKHYKSFWKFFCCFFLLPLPLSRLQFNVLRSSSFNTYTYIFYVFFSLFCQRYFRRDHFSSSSSQFHSAVFFVFSCQLVKLWCKRFLFIYLFIFFILHRFFFLCCCQCDWRIGRCLNERAEEKEHT